MQDSRPASDGADDLRLLLISGSTRSASTNSAALRTAQHLPPPGVTATSYDGLALLPAFNPDDDIDPLPPAVAGLRRQIAVADAVVFCTPEYAGALPGSFKNLLDWTVGGGEIYRKPAAWLHVAAEGRGENALTSLVTVLGYVGADLLLDACRRIPVPRQTVAADGLVGDPDLRVALTEFLDGVARQVRLHRSSG